MNTKIGSALLIAILAITPQSALAQRAPSQIQGQGQGQLQNQTQRNTQRNRQVQNAGDNTLSGSSDSGGNILSTDDNSAYYDLQPLMLNHAGLCERPSLTFGVQTLHTSEGSDTWVPQVGLAFPLGPNTCARQNQLESESQLANMCLALVGRVVFGELGGGLDRCPAILGLTQDPTIAP